MVRRREPLSPPTGETVHGIGTIRNEQAFVTRVRYQVTTSLGGKMAGSAILLGGVTIWRRSGLTLELEDGATLPIQLGQITGRLIRFIVLSKSG